MNTVWRTSLHLQTHALTLVTNYLMTGTETLRRTALQSSQRHLFLLAYHLVLASQYSLFDAFHRWYASYIMRRIGSLSLCRSSNDAVATRVVAIGVGTFLLHGVCPSKRTETHALTHI